MASVWRMCWANGGASATTMHLSRTTPTVTATQQRCYSFTTSVMAAGGHSPNPTRRGSASTVSHPLFMPDDLDLSVYAKSRPKPNGAPSAVAVPTAPAAPVMGPRDASGIVKKRRPYYSDPHPKTAQSVTRLYGTMLEDHVASSNGPSSRYDS
eukprot:TRINITY_DN883_c0_g1_i1.p1 TRINITY_DN883_c0_g1~~TRINITY_DN883_c0_g1_i1.p1  ORF type:complete len:153 (+),score=13.25 TRINITY_DN883_c0_g1_i1:197-655(+)